MKKRTLANRKITLSVLGTIIVVTGLIICIVLLAKGYQDNNFLSSFGTSIIATVIGVLVGAILGVFTAIGIVQPYLRRREEKRLRPLRESLLRFWEENFITWISGVFQNMECPHEIAQIVTEMSLKSQLHPSMIEPEKMQILREWLDEWGTEETISTRSLFDFKESISRLLEQVMRMHSTVAALPSLFKEAPEVAYSTAIQLNNLLSCLETLELEGVTANHIGLPHQFDFFQTAAIKKSVADTFSLIDIIHGARVELHQNDIEVFSS